MGEERREEGGARKEARSEERGATREERGERRDPLSTRLATLSTRGSMLENYFSPPASRASWPPQEKCVSPCTPRHVRRGRRKKIVSHLHVEKQKTAQSHLRDKDFICVLVLETGEASHARPPDVHSISFVFLSHFCFSYSASWARRVKLLSIKLIEAHVCRLIVTDTHL